MAGGLGNGSNNTLGPRDGKLRLPKEGVWRVGIQVVAKQEKHVF